MNTCHVEVQRRHRACYVWHSDWGTKTKATLRTITRERRQAKRRHLSEYAASSVTADYHQSTTWWRPIPLSIVYLNGSAEDTQGLVTNWRAPRFMPGTTRTNSSLTSMRQSSRTGNYSVISQAIKLSTTMQIAA